MNRVPSQSIEYRAEDGLYYLNGELFTGVEFYASKRGDWTKAEQEYREGMQWGAGRSWSRPGQIESEEHYLAGLKHGLCREWDRDGRLIQEAAYEFGIRIWAREWDGRGKLIRDERLQAGSPGEQALEAKRDWYAKAGFDQPAPSIPQPDDRLPSPSN